MHADNFKLRAAWGEAGRAPSPYSAVRTYTISVVTLGATTASALRTSVAAAYHSAPGARAAYGYGGQEPAPVPPFGYPDWLDEGLLDHLL